MAKFPYTGFAVRTNTGTTEQFETIYALVEWVQARVRAGDVIELRPADAPPNIADRDEDEPVAHIVQEMVALCNVPNAKPFEDMVNVAFSALLHAIQYAPAKTDADNLRTALGIVEHVNEGL